MSKNYNRDQTEELRLLGCQQVQKTSLGPNMSSQCQDDAKATTFLLTEIIAEEMEEKEGISQLTENLT